LEYASGRNPVRKELINDYLFYGLYEEALSEINKFSAYNPNTTDLDILWANYYFSTGKVTSAIERYNRALVYDNNFFVLYRIGSCYKTLGQFDKAIDFGLKSFKINPYFVLNLIQLGDLYAQKKQFLEAKKYYQMAFALNPHNLALESLLKNAE